MWKKYSPHDIEVARWSSFRSLKFSYIPFLSIIAGIVFLNIRACVNGQPIDIAFTSVLSIFAYTLISSSISLGSFRVVSFVCLLFEYTKGEIWYSYQSPLTMDFLKMGNPTQIVEAKASVFISKLSPVVLLFALCSVPTFSIGAIIPPWVHTVTFFSFSVPIYIANSYHFDNFNPLFKGEKFINPVELNSPRFKLIREFVKAPELIAHTNGTGKNVIHIELESGELQMLGPWSNVCKETCPYLGKLAGEHLFTDEFVRERSVSITIHARWATETGLPSVIAYDDACFARWSPHSLPKILNTLGYESIGLVAGPKTSFNQVAFFKTVQYKQVYYEGCNDDDLLWKRFIEQVLPEMKKKEKPFYILFETAGTHLGCTLGYKFCKKRFNNPKCTVNHQNFDCADQMVEKMMNVLNENGILDNTEIVINADHYFPEKPPGLTKPRKQGFWIPTRPYNKSKAHKKANMLDLVPTILDLLEIKTSPPFPFGVSLLSDEESHVSTSRERKYLFSLIEKYGYSSLDFRAIQ